MRGWSLSRTPRKLRNPTPVRIYSPTTIRHYKITRLNTPRGDQTWRTFLRNHGKAVWSCDSLPQHTAFFAVAYIFVIMEIGSRRIVHVNVTSNPTLPWVKQQIREATGFILAVTKHNHPVQLFLGQNII